jgi:hypothetical protein
MSIQENEAMNEQQLIHLLETFTMRHDDYTAALKVERDRLYNLEVAAGHIKEFIRANGGVSQLPNEIGAYSSRDVIVMCGWAK